MVKSYKLYFISLLFILLLVSLTSNIVSAQDDVISFSLNDHELSDNSDIIVFSHGENLTIDSVISPNISLESITVKTSNVFFQELIGYYLGDFEVNDFSVNDTFNHEVISLPEFLPSGIHQFNITLNYIDTSFNEFSLEKSVILDINSSSLDERLAGFALDYISHDVAAELVDFITGREPRKLPDDLSHRELRLLKDDLFLENLSYHVKKIEEKTLKKEVSLEDLDSLSSVNDNVASVLKRITGLDASPLIEKELQVFEVTDINGSVAYVSRVIIRIHYFDSSLNGLEIVEEIPKDVAVHVNEIAFLDAIDILENDPIVKWNINHVPKDSDYEIAYSVNKRLDDVQSTTVAGGNEPSLFAKFLSNLLAKFFN